MSAQYSVENQISANRQLCVGIGSNIYKEHNCTYLYLSYSNDIILLWINKDCGDAHFRYKDVNEELGSLDAFFANESFRLCGVLPEEHCEDRSLNGIQQKPRSCEEENHRALRIKKDITDNQGTKLNLSLWYKFIIAPVADILEGPEIVIVPEHSLYNVPFAALLDEGERYL